jgi:hypothetical protein
MSFCHTKCINGDSNVDATDAFRGQSVVKEELGLQTIGDVSYLYRPAADTYLLHSLPAGAVYSGHFYRYVWLFHHR